MLSGTLGRGARCASALVANVTESRICITTLLISTRYLACADSNAEMVVCVTLPSLKCSDQSLKHTLYSLFMLGFSRC